MKITGKTRVCGLIGDPVEHSVSPAMQNAAFAALGLDYVYLPWRVGGESLRAAVEGLKALDIRGVNVTIPHKVAIIPYLDELDSLAENLGAVNTIVNQGGYLIGYNTDASGFWRAFTAEKFDRQARIVILGAGGAARAVAFVLADKGADLTILNRHEKSALELAARLEGLFRRQVTGLELNAANLKAALAGADVVINTTSLGMSPNSQVSPLPSRLLRKALVVFDIVYNPTRTRLLAEAEKKGARTIGGIEMLVQQGAASLELWTGHKAPLEVMRQEALKAMAERED